MTIGDLFSKARERADLAFGLDPRSPHYRDRVTVLQYLRDEAQRSANNAARQAMGSARRGIGRVPGFRSAKKDAARNAQAISLARANPYVGAAYAAVHPVSTGRSLLRLLILFLLVIWLVYVAVLRPTFERELERRLGPLPDVYGRLDDFDEFLGDRPIIPGLPWGGIIPGSYEQCAGTIPQQPQVHRGGIVGVAHEVGSLFHKGVEVDLSMENMEEGILDTARSVGEAWRVFQNAAKNGGPAPMEPFSLAPSPPSAATPEAAPAPRDPRTLVALPASFDGPLTDEQVAALALEVGWPAEEVTSGRLGARVLAESGNDPRARDYVDGSHQGLLQLGQAEQAAYLTPGASVFDPRANLEAGLRLWQARGWQPWRASDAGHVQYLQRAQQAAQAAPQGSGTTVGGVVFAENAAPRTLTAGGSDPAWFVDRTGMSVQANGQTLVQTNPSGFGRMWTKSPVSGPFTVRFDARVLDWGNSGLDGTQPGLKMMLKVAHPNAPQGPEGVIGAGSTRPGSYVLPLIARNGETFVSRNPIGPGSYDFFATGNRPVQTARWRQVEVQVQPSPSGTRVAYYLDGTLAAEHVDSGSGALPPGPFWPTLRWDGAAWEVRGFQIVGGTMNCAPAPGGNIQQAAGGPASPFEQRLRDFILAQVGEPYVWGGTGPDGWDCSGLLYGAHKELGRPLNVRTAAQMWSRSDPIPAEQARAGDIVFSQFGSGRGGVPDGPGHMMIALGDGRAVEAPRRGLDVRIRSMPTGGDAKVYRLRASAFAEGVAA